MKHFLNLILNDIYPNGLVCLDCKDEIKKEEDRYFSLCEKCRENLPVKKEKSCVHCGSEIATGTVCKDCFIVLPYYDKMYVDFRYDGLIRKVIIKYKDFKERYLYEYIVKFLLNTYNKEPIEVDYITFVPSDKKSIRLRGFEPNRKVAEEMSKKINKPCKRFLNRINKTVDQTKLSKEERLKNIKNDFKYDSNEDLSGKVVLLIDDVVTSGHTVNECARILKFKGNAGLVYVLALARA